jgi:hypothetical protein
MDFEEASERVHIQELDSMKMTFALRIKQLNLSKIQVNLPQHPGLLPEHISATDKINTPLLIYPSTVVTLLEIKAKISITSLSVC